MTSRPSGAKGYELEEVLRNYFLRANFYVVRSLPLRMGGDDLTDVDIWLYERPSGFARRRLIVDAKFKARPKAAERLFWVRGVSEFLKVDGAYVATTDSRSNLREMARRVGVAVLDGTDLGRIASSDKVESPERLTDEELTAMIRQVDQERLSKTWTLQLDDAKASLLENFGVASGNRCLGGFGYFAEEAAVAHPNSTQAEVAVRAACLTASMAAVSLDYVANEAAFRTSDERRRILTNGIRFGNIDSDAGLEKIRVAMALVSEFTENGSALAHQISNKYHDELMKIPAEIVADQVARMAHRETLFLVARELELSAYGRKFEGFATLTGDAKSLVAAFLDFCGVSRNRFANAFTGSPGAPLPAAPATVVTDTSPAVAPEKSEELPLGQIDATRVPTKEPRSKKPQRAKQRKD
jgi:hypothetical protein